MKIEIPKQSFLITQIGEVSFMIRKDNKPFKETHTLNGAIGLIKENLINQIQRQAN